MKARLVDAQAGGETKAESWHRFDWPSGGSARRGDSAGRRGKSEGAREQRDEGGARMRR